MVDGEQPMANGNRKAAAEITSLQGTSLSTLLYALASFSAMLLAVRAAKCPAKVIRITSGDPVAFGFAVSLAQPGGNITGAGNSVRNGSNWTQGNLIADTATGCPI